MGVGVVEVLRGVESAIGIGCLKNVVPKLWESGEERAFCGL
jgi:hypothetical protein